MKEDLKKENAEAAESFSENINEEIKPKYVDVCLGVGMNQLFPETTRIILEESDEENS
jgi:hypothetical protein